MKYKISGHSSHPGAPSPANAFTSTSPTPFDEVCSLLLLNVNRKYDLMYHNLNPKNLPTSTQLQRGHSLLGFPSDSMSGMNFGDPAGLAPLTRLDGWMVGWLDGC